jgi:hypothetical protein
LRIRLAVGVEQTGQVALAELDALVDRQTLNDVPMQIQRWIGADRRLTFLDLVNGPKRPVRDLMQRVHDPGSASLTNRV